MTKHRRTVTLSKELDDTIALLAAGKQMNYSEFLETRLRTVQEIASTIERINYAPDDPLLVRTKPHKESPDRQKSKMKKTRRESVAN
ncbi:MAG: hypothetical protein DA330_04605 [Nitrososphaera sp.]|nr:hypothetical protein [Nitrososphaera sp.]